MAFSRSDTTAVEDSATHFCIVYSINDQTDHNADRTDPHDTNLIRK